MGTIVIASGNAIQGSYAQPLVIQSSSSNNGIYLNKNTASSGNITITTGNSFVTQLWNEGNNSLKAG